MGIAALCRAATEDDRPPAWLVEGLGAGADPGACRLLGRRGGEGFWLIPALDGRTVLFVIGGPGGATGGPISAARLDEPVVAAMHGLSGSRWRCALLVGDGYDRARVGDAEVQVRGNLAVLELPERARVVELTGPAGPLTVDLGPAG